MREINNHDYNDVGFGVGGEQCMQVRIESALFTRTFGGGAAASLLSTKASLAAKIKVMIS